MFHKIGGRSSCPQTRQGCCVFQSFLQLNFEAFVKLQQLNVLTNTTLVIVVEIRNQYLIVVTYTLPSVLEKAHWQLRVQAHDTPREGQPSGQETSGDCAKCPLASGLPVVAVLRRAAAT